MIQNKKKKGKRIYWKRKRAIALFGVLALEESIELSQDRLHKINIM